MVRGWKRKQVLGRRSYGTVGVLF